MAMNETLIAGAGGGAGGMVLGAIFFGGLWWTVRKGLSSPRRRCGSWQPAAADEHCLAGFYLSGDGIGNGCWPCLVGFIMARLHRDAAHRHAETPTPVATEASHAP
jgi:F1F0 ATPase subunit 2